MDSNNNLNKMPMKIELQLKYASGILIICILYMLYKTQTEKYVHAPLDGKMYNVKNLENNIEAANTLAIINKNISTLVKHLKRKYGKHHLIVKNILNRFNPDVITEHIPSFFDSNVAYTSNKGKSLNICLRTLYTNQNKIHKINLIMFVALHELAHIGTNVKNHPMEFWQVFKFILIEAKNAGVYIPINYAKEKTIYCDEMIIDYNPYYDVLIHPYTE